MALVLTQFFLLSFFWNHVVSAQCVNNAGSSSENIPPIIIINSSIVSPPTTEDTLKDALNPITSITDKNPAIRITKKMMETFSFINKIQNPEVCEQENFFVFTEKNPIIGFGAWLSTFVSSAISAFSEGKGILIGTLEPHSKCGWNCYFIPISRCQYLLWENSPKKFTSSLGATFKLNSSFTPENHLLPQLWSRGIVGWYLLQPALNITEKIDTIKISLGWGHPIVGVHVRRTDKIGTEAKFHSLEEYMDRVEMYYLLHWTHLKPEFKRVLICTDEPSVISEAREKYGKSFQILSTENYKTAGKVALDRANDNSTLGILIDFLLLSETDFLVGTFSSNVGRLVYEQMQARKISDGMSSAITLMHDDWYIAFDIHGKSIVKEHEYEKNFIGIYAPEETYIKNDAVLSCARNRTK